MQNHASLTYIDVEGPQRQRKRRFRRLQPAVRRYVPLLLLLAAGYRLAGLSFGEMQQWDEAIYALRTDTVLLFGDLWDQSPQMLRGSYYAAHPPLYVWCSTAAVLVFGDALWVYRLTSALAGALCVLLLYRIARRFTTRAFSFAAAAWFAAAPLPAFMSRQGQLDLLLAAAMFATLLFMLRALRSGGGVAGASVMLGLSLMTKLFYAFSLPLTALASAGFFEGEARRRALRLGMLLPVLSSPIWLPWLLSFVGTHLDGNPLNFLAAETPLGASIAGSEGAPKDTGVFYYLNQLVVHLGLLFPLYVTAMVQVVRKRESPALLMLATFTLVQGMELFLLRSSFEVYLIPLLGPCAILAMRSVPRVRRWSIGARLSIGLAMAVCASWSLSAGLRDAVKQTLLNLHRPELIPGDALSGTAVLAALVLSATGAVLITWRRGALRSLYTAGFMQLFVLLLWGSTAYRSWVVDPVIYADGAERVVAAAMSCPADTLVLVGNGDNPQLTWYLRGADIGWDASSSKVFVRMEPKDMGVENIMQRLAGMQRTGAGVILEKDEIAAGVYRSPADVLPAGYAIVTDAARYCFALPGGDDNVR